MKICEVDLQNHPLYELGQEVHRGALSLEQALQRAGSPGVLELLDEDTIDEMDDYLRGLLDEQQQHELCRILAELNYRASQAMPASHSLQAFCADVLDGALSNSLHKSMEQYVSVLDRRITICREAKHIWEELGNESMVASMEDSLGGALLARFEALGRATDLDSATESYRRALDAVDVGSLEWATYQSNLGMTFEARFEASGETEDLDTAVRFHKEALRVIEEGSCLWASVQGNLGVALDSRFEARGEISDLDSAIKAYKTALKATREGSSDWAGWKSNLAGARSDRFEMLGEMADLDASVKAHGEALAVTPEGSLRRAMYENNLGLALLDRFELQGRVDDLNAAVSAHRGTLSIVQEKSPAWAKYQNNLGAALRTRFAALGHPKDLSAAIRAYRQSLEATREGSSNWATATTSLANALLSRYEALGTEKDLDAAVEAYRKALGAMRLASPDWATCQGNLGVALRARFEAQGEVADLDTAIQAQHRALGAVQPGTLKEATCRNNLGTALHARFEALGQVEDLEAAIRTYRRALMITRKDSLDWGTVQANLGAALSGRFEVLGETGDLEAGIDAYEQALRGVMEGGPGWVVRLGNLSAAFQTRFEALGQMKDLDAAVALLEQALQLTRERSPNWRAYHTNLGAALSRRFEALGQARDLEKAVRYYRRALDTAGEGSPDWATCQANLGTVLSIRFDAAGEVEDMEEAIEAYEKALEVLPESSVARVNCLVNLGNAQIRRSEALERREDLGTAIATLQRALRATAHGSLDWAVCQANLGIAYRTRFTALDETVDLCSAITAYQEALTFFRPEVFPDYTLVASLPLGHLLLTRGKRGDFARAVQTYQAAGSAAAHLYFESLLQRRRRHQLDRVQDMPANHAYALAKKGDLKQAVEVLEAGRARALTETLQGTEALSAIPDSAQREVLQKAHQRVKEAENAFLHFDETSRNRVEQKLAKARRVYYDLLRDLFPDFFGKYTFTEVREAAADSPLVYLLATPAGGLALIVHVGSAASGAPGSREVSAVWLPGITSKRLRERMLGPEEDPALGGYLGAYDEWRTNRCDKASGYEWQATLYDMVRWLGRSIISPVVESLEEQLCNRATLVPLGLLGLLPLHAASDTGVAFSYSPNAHTLTVARDRAHKLEPLSLVAVNSPDDKSEFSSAEIQAAFQHFSQDRRLHLAGGRATSEAVCEALETYAVWHFSTHGWAGWQEPLSGGLLLANDEHLSLRDIFSLEVEARLAVLSACETGVVGTDLPNEVIGLPTGLLQAGVAGVIGSLWAVDDFSTAVLMSQFYENWLGKGEDPDRALHTAQQWLRKVRNEELVTYFKQGLPEFGRHKLPKKLADIGYRQSALRKADARPFSHPFYWAGFYYAGV